MNIGFDAKRAFCNSRGLGNYSRNTIRIMTQAFPSYSFSLFTPKIKEELNVNFPTSNIKTILPKGCYAYTPLSSLWRTSSICKEIKSNNINLYHGLSHELPYGIEKTGAKTILTMHDVIFLKHPELYHLFDRYVFKKKYKHGCDIADRIIAISQQTKLELMEYMGIDENRIDVVYQGCNPIFHQEVSEYALKQTKELYNLPNEFMLIVSAIERRKNHELILKAMREPKIDLPLVIVGRGDEYKKELIRMAKEWGVEKRITFLTNVRTETLPALYKLATLFIYPSLFEGFGIPILESLTVGTPVITSKGSCFQETGGDAAKYVSSDNEEELASTILQLLDNHELRKLMVQKGFKHIRKFSDQTIAKNLMTVYNKVL